MTTNSETSSSSDISSERTFSPLEKTKREMSDPELTWDLKTNFARYSLFPIKFPSLYEFYKKQRDSYWVPNEVDLETDINEWRTKLSDNDKHFLTTTLAFFAQADGIVLRNLHVNFSMDIDIPEASLFYGIQGGIEAIHWEMYAILIDTLINDISVREQAFNAIENYPCIKKKAEWMTKWMSSTVNSNYLERLVAFACAEGIFFSSAFASIFYYKKRGLMPGLTLSNKFISRDEGLHRDFGCDLFKILRSGKVNGYENLNITDEQVYAIVKDSVDIECEFVDVSLNVEMIGINKNSMKDYVKFVANHLLVTLGLQKLYTVTNPFDWMDMINLSNKQNFFEGKVSEYKKVQATPVFSVNEEF